MVLICPPAGERSMAHGGFLSVDLGHPFLNRTADGFLKVGAVGACKVAAEETFHCLHKGSVAGVYVGVEYGVDRIRGHRDWNAVVGGAVTGALVSAANGDDRKHVVSNAITGAAIATAAHYLHHLT
ncbi:hypothetical protein ACQ4PT_061964 [Festuca glaucescens]